MELRIVALSILVLTTAAAQAGQMYKCTSNGRTVFSDTPCGKDAQPIQVEIQNRSDGLRPGEQRMLDRAYLKDERRYQEKRRAQERSTRHHVSYGDRLRLRELEMRRKQVMKKMQRTSITYGESKVLREEIRSIDREIGLIKKPKY